MLNEKEFYQYVEANILNYLPEMEGKKVMVQRVKRNNFDKISPDTTLVPDNSWSLRSTTPSSISDYSS